MTSGTTRVLHTADTHLGYRQYGSDERRADFLRSFEAVVDDAVSGDYDALVHAGDLFHSRNPSLVDVIPTVECFRRLRDAGVRALAVVGNHERKRSQQWLDLLGSMGLVERLGREPVVVGDVCFYGVDYVPPSEIDGFDYGFEACDAGFSVLVGHGRFEPFPYGEWRLSEFVERSDVDWDAFLLGDYHHFERED
ncbi:MAG: metallophosphoesterase, partial [Halobacteriales archaeon]